MRNGDVEKAAGLVPDGFPRFQQIDEVAIGVEFDFAGIATDFEDRVAANLVEEIFAHEERR